MTIDDLLKEWACWSKARTYYGHTGSLEGRYRSPQCWHPQEARPPEINEQRALETERIMRFLPSQYRKLIKFSFIYRAEPKWVCLRVVIPIREYDLYLGKAKHMVSNLLGLTKQNKQVIVGHNSEYSTYTVRPAA